MIYFVSDIHLGGGTPLQARRSEQAFCRWLDSVAEDATAIYLLGDIFDFWFEYRRVVPQGFVRVLGRLAALTDRGVDVVLYVGNHDMWCYDYLTRECGIRIEFRPRIEQIAGRNIHLAHGDNMNVGNQPMLRMMNGMFRSGAIRWCFRWFIHPDIALRFGRWWSGKSRKSHSSEHIIPESLGHLVEYATGHHAKHSDVEAYIFGHMHYAHRYNTPTTSIFFLSDWSGAEATYATLDDNGLKLKTFTIDETIS